MSFMLPPVTEPGSTSRPGVSGRRTGRVSVIDYTGVKLYTIVSLRVFTTDVRESRAGASQRGYGNARLSECWIA